jgi:hypothetical protein
MIKLVPAYFPFLAGALELLGAMSKDRCEEPPKRQKTPAMRALFVRGRHLYSLAECSPSHRMPLCEDWRGRVVENKQERFQPRGPLPLVIAWLTERLPQEDDVWQADCRQLTEERPDGATIGPWVVLVTSRSNDLVLAYRVATARPAPALLWDTLVQAMRNPALGGVHRPSELEVRPRRGWESLRSHIHELGIRLAVCEELGQIESVLQHLT